MKKILYIIGAMLALASCTQEMADDITSLDGAVNFTTSNSITRASAMESWAGGESVGIYSKNSTDIVDNNVEYTAVDATPVKFSAVGDPICYTSVSAELSFVAYYPFNEDNTSEDITIDLVNNQDDILVSDVISAAQDDNKSVDFTFSHILSMVSIDISSSDQITDLSDLRIFIANSNTAATYDLYAETGSALSIGSDHGHIEMAISEDGTKATAFVMPSDYTSSDAIIFYIEVAKRTFHHEMNPTWVAGTKYTYSATVGYDYFDIAPTDENDIKEWEDGTTTVDIYYDDDDGVYCINTGKGLAAFRDLANGAGENTSGATYWGDADKFNFASTNWNGNINGKLMNDISLSDVCSSGDGWSPIGTYTSGGNGDTYYYGTFDGDGHAVTNLEADVSGGTGAGLFGYTNGGAKIKNLSVDGSVTGSNYVGGLVGYADGSSDSYYTTITNCSSNVGVCDDGGLSSVGGLVGELGKYSIINQCSSSGNVTGMGSSDVGGLVGKTEQATIINSYATGGVYANSGSNVGGLVGYNTEKSKIVNCYCTASTIYGDTNVGGLVGCNGYNDNDTSSITNCYTTTIVSLSGTTNGGVVGYNYAAATVTDCYYNSSLSSGIGDNKNTSGASATGKDTDELKALASTLTETAATYNSTDPAPDPKACEWTSSNNSYPTLDFDTEAGATPD